VHPSRAVSSVGAVLTALPLVLGALVAPTIAPPAAAAGQTVLASPQPLPTAQVDGIVLDQAVVGNTVYVVGEFKSARPAGAAAGENESPRYNAMAFDITTGALLDWAPKVNSRVTAVEASADGSTIYLGGNFTSVNDETTYRVAAGGAAAARRLGVVEPGTPGFDAIIAAFGAELLTADGALDRALLAERVFNDPDARGTLEAIMLPQVAQTAAQRMEAAAPGGVAVYDVPLLVEEGMEDLFDCVMVVETPRALRLARLQRRGLTREDAESRIASQAGDEERRQVADIVLLNNGTREDLADGVEWLWTNRIAVN